MKFLTFAKINNVKQPCRFYSNNGIPQIIRHRQISALYFYSMSQLILQPRQPEPLKQLVESQPVQEGTKLSQKQIKWEDLQGLF